MGVGVVGGGYPEGNEGLEDKGAKPEGAGVGIGMKPDDEVGIL